MTYPFATDPVPPGHGEPELTKVGEANRTYAVNLVYADGNPQTEKRFASLEEALRYRDKVHEETHPPGRERSAPHVFVIDEDDPERGELDYE